MDKKNYVQMKNDGRKISHRMIYGLNWIVEINARGF